MSQGAHVLLVRESLKPEAQAVRSNSDILCRSVLDVEQHTVDWRIENYSYLIKEKGQSIESPTFKVGKNKPEWQMLYYPEGTSASKEGFASVFLCLKSKSNITATFQISVLSQAKDKVNTRKGKRLFKGPQNWGFAEYFNIVTFFENGKGYVDNDTLTFHLELSTVENIIKFSSDIPVDNSDSNDMSEDYLNLLNTSMLSDFVIFVNNRQFKVHKAVLCARSPVFAAMLIHDSQESKTNTLQIEDVDPDVMECVIQYIYSGKCIRLNELSGEILPVADKYCLRHLKLMCEEMLSSQLEVGNVVSILSLADLHSAQTLKKKSIEFICSNRKNVLSSDEWISLSSDNKELALEVCLALI